jgi:hypothetical protein
MICRKDLWVGLIQLAIHAESISWTRFYNFLMGNSILILAWATLYVSQQHRVITSVVMFAICLLGGATGLAWSALGTRTRKYINLHFDQALLIEKDSATWADGIPNESKPFIEADKIRSGNFRFSSNPFLLKWVPLAFTTLYIIMAVASWLGC